jgi:hypothetical protein
MLRLILDGISDGDQRWKIVLDGAVGVPTPTRRNAGHDNP